MLWKRISLQYWTGRTGLSVELLELLATAEDRSAPQSPVLDSGMLEPREEEEKAHLCLGSLTWSRSSSSLRLSLIWLQLGHICS